MYRVYWPLTVQFTDPDPDRRKYFALNIDMKTDRYFDGVYSQTFDERRGIGVAELSKLQDNPDVEAEDLLMNTDPVGLYYFGMLLQSNLTFSRGMNTLNYYMSDESRYTYYECSDGNPAENDPNYIRVSNHHTYYLRVKRITTETFKYYRSLTLQRAGMGFFSEPVTVVGNIEKGYGCFSAVNSVSIPLLELEECRYRKKE